jgi:hypothetical protein
MPAAYGRLQPVSLLATVAEVLPEKTYATALAAH